MKLCWNGRLSEPPFSFVECPLRVNSGCSDDPSARSVLPPTTEVRRWMSEVGVTAEVMGALV